MSQRKVLVADDSNTVLLLHRMTLKSTGYELVTARDGQEAVEKALKERPDLILLDVVMPRMTGIEACKQLRAQATTQETPIIMVTTRGEPHNVEAGYQAGCTDYMTKPFDGAELLEKLKHYLGA